MLHKNNPKILFIGSFLSASRGSKGPTEHIASQLETLGFKTTLASRYSNIFLRLLDIVIKSLFFKGTIVCIDVYSGNAFRIAELAAAIAKLKGHKIVLNLHGGRLPEFLQQHNSRVRKLFYKADEILSPSLFLINVFKTNNLNVSYLPNPIQLNNFKFNRSKITPYSILWVRAFDKIYNPNIPPNILAIVKQKYPQASLTMVGPDCGELNHVKSIVNKLGLSGCVTFAGPVPNNQLFEYYQTHAVFLNTTSYESFGVSLMEAASCGIPIVSNNVGEISLIWEDKKNIMLVNENNINDHANAVLSLFSSSSMADNLAIEASLNTKKFNQNEIIKKWISLFTDM
jgi:glycosyltransferase involved in cell wall biosynthesis